MLREHLLKKNPKKHKTKQAKAKDLGRAFALLKRQALGAQSQRSQADQLLASGMADQLSCDTGQPPHPPAVTASSRRLQVPPFQPDSSECQEMPVGMPPPL